MMRLLVLGVLTLLLATACSSDITSHQTTEPQQEMVITIFKVPT
jgi:uncharacterized protein YcfL